MTTPHDPAPRLRLVYDENAHAYGQANAEIDSTTRAFATDFTEQLPEGATILDAGCGSGQCSELFASLGFQVTGIDISPVMLTLARERSPESGFLEMDMRRLDFPDARFEGLWVSAAFLHLPKEDAPAALAEFRRVLRQGAPLAVTVKAGEGEGWEPSPYGSFERFYSRYGEDEIAQLFAQSFDVSAIVRATDRGEEWLLVSATAR
jgi:ubiquinone/menaquinone biosynthesis C-methylase UbiE